MSCYHIPKSRSHLGLKPSHAICRNCGAEIVKVKPRKYLFRIFFLVMLYIFNVGGARISAYNDWILIKALFGFANLAIVVFAVTRHDYKCWQEVDAIMDAPIEPIASECCRHKPDNPFISILPDKATSPDQQRRCMKCGAIIQMKKPHRLFAKIAAILINIASFIMYFFCLILFVYDAKTTGGMIKFSVISYIIFAVLLLLRVFGLGDLCRWERVDC